MLFFFLHLFVFLRRQALVVALVVGIMHVPQHTCGGQRATHVGPRVKAQVMGFDGHIPVTSEPTLWSLLVFEIVSCNLEFLMSLPRPPKP